MNKTPQQAAHSHVKKKKKMLWNNLCECFGPPCCIQRVAFRVAVHVLPAHARARDNGVPLVFEQILASFVDEQPLPDMRYS
jgi:hypothetical protein